MGEQATRLGRLTLERPKSLVCVQGRPFLEHQLARLREAGIEDVVLCVGHLGEQIERHFGDGRLHGVKIRYSYEETPLGTAGALGNAGGLLEDPFFTMYGDSYLFVDFAAVLRFFESRSRFALMTVYRNHGRFERSNAVVDGDLVSRYEKRAETPGMDYIDYGVNVFRKRVIEMMPSGAFYSLEDLFPRLIARRQLSAFEVRERFYQIGSLDGLEEFGEYLAGVA